MRKTFMPNILWNSFCYYWDWDQISSLDMWYVSISSMKMNDSFHRKKWHYRYFDWKKRCLIFMLAFTRSIMINTLLNNVFNFDCEYICYLMGRFVFPHLEHLVTLSMKNRKMEIFPRVLKLSRQNWLIIYVK